MCGKGGCQGYFRILAAGVQAGILQVASAFTLEQENTILSKIAEMISGCLPLPATRPPLRAGGGRGRPPRRGGAPARGPRRGGGPPGA